MSTTRHVIVNADDFGLSAGVNRGIIDAFERGILTSTSFMVRQPAAEEAAEYARANPKLGVGLHLDLGEWVCVRGHWMTRYMVVPIDAKFPRYLDEIQRQLDRFRDLIGREPSHIDSHQHFHRNEPVRSGLFKIAASLGLPLRELTPAITYRGGFYGQCGRGVSYPELVSVSALRTMLKELQPGVTEVGCHPAAAHDFESPYGSERLLELRALCDDSVRETVIEQKLKLISFNDLAAEQRQPHFHPES